MKRKYRISLSGDYARFSDAIFIAYISFRIELEEKIRRHPDQCTKDDYIRYISILKRDIEAGYLIWRDRIEFMKHEMNERFYFLDRNNNPTSTANT